MSSLDYGSADKEAREVPYKGFLNEVDDVPYKGTGQELKVIVEVKDQWFYGTSEEQKEVVEEAVKALIAIEPRDPVMIQKKVHKWLKRWAGK